MEISRIPNGGSAIPHCLTPKRGRYIGKTTVPTLQAGLTKMFGLMNVVFGILLIANGIAVIIVRAGNYQAGAGVWGGTFATCAGVIALMTGTKRKCVVIPCVALTSFAIIAVFAAGIVAGTGMQTDEEIKTANKDNSAIMKAKIGLNAVTIGISIASFIASLFIVFLCGRALDDAAFASEIDVSNLYPSSRVSRGSMDGINNPVFIEEQSKGVAKGSIRLLNPKQPILLLPLKERQMDTLSISYDLTDGHTQTCRIVRCNTPSHRGSSESVAWSHSQCREDVVHVEVPPENEPQCRSENYSRNNAPWYHEEVAVEIEIQDMQQSYKNYKNTNVSDVDGRSFIVLDTVDAKKRLNMEPSSGDNVRRVPSGNYRVSESESDSRNESDDEYEQPTLTHWDTQTSLDRESGSSLGFTDIINMCPDSRSNSLASPAESEQPDDSVLRMFVKGFVDDICVAALNEVEAEMYDKVSVQGSQEDDKIENLDSSGTCTNVMGSMDDTVGESKPSASDSEDSGIKSRLFQHLAT